MKKKYRNAKWNSYNIFQIFSPTVLQCLLSTGWVPKNMFHLVLEAFVVVSSRWKKGHCSFFSFFSKEISSHERAFYLKTFPRPTLRKKQQSFSLCLFYTKKYSQFPVGGVWFIFSQYYHLVHHIGAVAYYMCCMMWSTKCILTHLFATF